MTSYASFASRLSYQGRLTDTSGNAVANGTYSVRFAIYTDAQTTDAAWIETQNVTVQNGVFSAILGSINPINIDFNANEYYLGIKVGTDSEMTPRRQIAASAMALNSKRLDGKEVGTNANNILALNSTGGIDISGQIKTSGGIDVTSGVINAMGGFQLNSVAVNASANELNYLTGSTSNIQGQLNNLSTSVSTTQSQLDSKLGLTGGTTNGSFSHNVSGDYTLQVDGEGAILVGDENFYFMDQNDNDIMTINNNGNIIIDSGSLNVASTIESGSDITSGGNIYLQNGSYIGLGAAFGQIVFNDESTDEIEIQNANLLINSNDIQFGDNHGIVSSSGAARLKFQLGGNGVDMSGALTLIDTTVNSAIIFYDLNSGDHGIGFGSGHPYINFNYVEGNSGTITIQDSDFVVEGNNNYYICTTQPNCTQTPDALTGRTITVNNTSGGSVSQFNGISLVKGSDGSATSIINNEIIYAVYQGNYWAIIGQGH